MKIIEIIKCNKNTISIFLYLIMVEAFDCQLKIIIVNQIANYTKKWKQNLQKHVLKNK